MNVLIAQTLHHALYHSDNAMLKHQLTATESAATLVRGCMTPTNQRKTALWHYAHQYKVASAMKRSSVSSDKLSFGAYKLPDVTARKQSVASSSTLQSCVRSNYTDTPGSSMKNVALRSGLNGYLRQITDELSVLDDVSETPSTSPLPPIQALEHDEQEAADRTADSMDSDNDSSSSFELYDDDEDDDDETLKTPLPTASVNSTQLVRAHVRAAGGMVQVPAVLSEAESELMFSESSDYGSDYDKSSSQANGNNDDGYEYPWSSDSDDEFRGMKGNQVIAVILQRLRNEGAWATQPAALNKKSESMEQDINTTEEEVIEQEEEDEKVMSVDEMSETELARYYDHTLQRYVSFIVHDVDDDADTEDRDDDDDADSEHLPSAFLGRSVSLMSSQTTVEFASWSGDGGYGSDYGCCLDDM